jgi:hypothetical protein
MIITYVKQPDNSNIVVATYPDGTDVGTVRNDHPEATSIEERMDGTSENVVLWDQEPA